MRYSTSRVALGHITTMKFLLDFFPVILFFMAYKIFGDLPPQLIESTNNLPFVTLDPKEPKDAIYFATLTIIAATLIQNISHWFIFKKLEKMHIISLVILIIFGSLTLAFKGSLIKSNKFWQRQVSKFETLISSIVILWFKSITKKLGTWLSPDRADLQGITSVVINFPKGATILKIYA